MQFALVALATVIVTRIFLYLKPISSPTIRNFEMHHYMYGLALIPLGIYLESIALYAIGFGLFVDELTFVLIKGRDHKDNYSKKSLAGTTLFTGIMFMSKSFLVAPLI